MISKNGAVNWLLLMPMFFIDAYESSPSRVKDSIAIYVCFANASAKELKQACSWKLVCIVPQGDTAFFLDVLHHVVVEPIRKLEQGLKISFHALNGVVKCYGSVFDFIGDHPGLAEIMRTMLLTLSVYTALIHIYVLFETKCGLP